VDLEPTTLQLMLEDDGHPFNPLDHPEPDVHLPAEDRIPGGLGIHLVRKLADRMDYRRCAGRNRVIVQVRIDDERQPALP
jgi:serine/threonine-protein kinase RsbW